MARARLVAVVVFSLVIGGVAGYYAGSRMERTTSQTSVADALASKTLVGIRLNIQLLTAMREKQLDLVKDVELWTVLQLSQIDPVNYAKGSAPEYLYPETLQLVSKYQKQFPDTMIDPQKNPTIAKAFLQVR